MQLLGRWGSDAVKVYVQEAPLYRGDPHHRGHENDKPEQISEMVEHYLDTLRQKFWVVNTSRVSETSTDSTHWHTICGWPYGFAPHRREYQEPGGPKCKRCFNLREAQEFPDQAIEDYE